MGPWKEALSPFIEAQQFVLTRVFSCGGGGSVCFCRLNQHDKLLADVLTRFTVVHAAVPLRM